MGISGFEGPLDTMNSVSLFLLLVLQLCIHFVCLFVFLYCLIFMFFFSYESDFYRMAGMLLVQFLTGC